MANEVNWKGHPVFVFSAMLIVLGGGLTAFGSITGSYAASHTTEAELQIVRVQVANNSIESECRHLVVMINLAETDLWQMEQAGDKTSRRHVEKTNALRDLRSRSDKLQCASVLRKH